MNILFLREGPLFVAMALIIIGLPAPATAQTTLLTVDGDAPGDFFGSAASGAGDVNADGVPDFIIGASRNDDVANDSGKATVYSGTDGSVLYTFFGDSSFDFLGFSVGGAGDVNADGHADVIVGALDNRVQVFSGADGTRLHAFFGNNFSDRFGWSVNGAGDVNADGFDDLIVGAISDDNRGTSSGSARVFSGADGSILYTFDGDRPGDELGRSVAGVGDVNGDGFDDVIAGAWLADSNGEDAGAVRVYSGADGSILFDFFGNAAFDRLGVSVSGAGDVNGDGTPDFIAGAQLEKNVGSAWVVSGADGSVLHSFFGKSPFGSFGISVGCAGDVNADGVPDLIVGTREPDDRGSARLFSGATGAMLLTIFGDQANDNLGVEVAGVGDINGDGLDDVLLGAPFVDTANGVDSGSARVVSTLAVVLLEELGIDAVLLGLPNGSVNKIRQSLEALADAKLNVAVNKLEDFINQVEGQRGQQLSDAEANFLVGQADAIVFLLL